MKDITSKQDIDVLVAAFYDKARKDEMLGHIFNNIIGDDWSDHLIRITAFWDMVIFAAPGYAGSPVKAHIDADKKEAMNKEHFDRWLELWAATVDELFAGAYAEIAKNKAMLMANMIHIKVEMSRNGFNTLN